MGRQEFKDNISFEVLKLHDRHCLGDVGGLWGFGVGRNHLLGSLELRLMNLKWGDCLPESGSAIIFYSHELYPELPSCFVKHWVNDEDRYRRTNPPHWLIQQMFCRLLVGGWLNLRKIIRKLTFVYLRN